MTNQIKPCPFCGRVATAPGDGPSLVSDCNDYRYVTCPCGVDGPEHDDDDEAIAAWNAAPRMWPKPLTPAERAVLDAAVAWAQENYDLQMLHQQGRWYPTPDCYAYSPILQAAEALARERRGGSDEK